MTIVPFTDGATADIDIAGTTFVFRRGQFPAPYVYSGDTAPAADRLRATFSGLADEPFLVGVDVPYVAAKPQRWRHSQSGIPAIGPVDCTEGKGVPWQDYHLEDQGSNTNGRPTFGLDVGLANWPALGRHEDENCQNMMIFAKEGLTDAPVFLYLTGGGGDVGAAQSPNAYAVRLALEGNIVAVPNYRRAYHGHMHNASYAGEADWDGPNFALGDARAALLWVASHLGTNITVIGESFGAALALALCADPEAKQYIKNAVICSGAGGGERRSLGLSRHGSAQGYGSLCGEFQDRIAAAAPYESSPSERYQTVQDAIDGRAGGISVAMRNDIRPEVITFNHDTRNLFLWRDNIHVNHINAIAAANAGEFNPDLNIILVVSTDEMSVTTPANVNPEGYARFAGFQDFAEWEATDWWQDFLTVAAGEPDPDYAEKMAIYSGTLYWSAAYRLAMALSGKVNSVKLCFDGYVGQGVNTEYCTHTSFANYALGFPLMEWKLGMDGEEAKIYARCLYHSEGLVRLLKNLAASGDPNGPLGLDYKMFANDPAYTLTEFDPAARNWNVLGSTSLSSANAPASVTNIPGGIGGTDGWFDKMMQDLAARAPY